MQPFNPDLGSGLRRTPQTDAENLGKLPVPTFPPPVPGTPVPRPHVGPNPLPPDHYAGRGVPALAANFPPPGVNSAAMIERLETLLRSPALRLTVAGGGLRDPAEVAPANVVLLDRGEVTLIVQLLRGTMDRKPV